MKLIEVSSNNYINLDKVISIQIMSIGVATYNVRFSLEGNNNKDSRSFENQELAYEWLKSFSDISG